MTRTRKPVVDGWFRERATPAPSDGTPEPPAAADTAEPAHCVLLGTQCRTCSAVFFPREDTFCRNPHCAGTDLVETPLSRRGTIWSYTDARYQPPHPYRADGDGPWQPYALLAVELAAEHIVVLGQAPPGVTTRDLAVGMAVELVPGVLNEDEEHIWTTWHWKPLPANSTPEAGT